MKIGYLPRAYATRILCNDIMLYSSRVQSACRISEFSVMVDSNGYCGDAYPSSLDIDRKVIHCIVKQHSLPAIKTSKDVIISLRYQYWMYVLFTWNSHPQGVLNSLNGWHSFTGMGGTNQTEMGAKSICNG